MTHDDKLRVTAGVAAGVSVGGVAYALWDRGRAAQIAIIPIGVLLILGIQTFAESRRTGS